MLEPATSSADEREMLRRSVRGILQQRWPAANAVERAADENALRTVWRELVASGLTSLCGEPDAGGLAEALVVMEELGRAACPAPILGSVLTNIASLPHQDEDCIGFAFLSEEEPTNGVVQVKDGAAFGRLHFVEAASIATHLVVISPSDILCVETNRGFVASPTRALGTFGLWDVALEGPPVSRVLAKHQPEDLHRIARLGVIARAHGAARRSFELVVEYVKERRQFGRPVGSFQAIQHKLANCFIALEGVRQTTEAAALSYDRGEPDWRYFAAAADSYAFDALRQVSLETQHAFGAIGYAEDHEAPRHFRRVHLDTLAWGGARRARVYLAGRFLDTPNATVPPYDLGDAGNAFRAEVRAWLEKHWTPERRRAFASHPFHDREYDPEFARELGSTGWIGLSWPQIHGGQGRSPLEQIAFLEEMERVDAPRTGAAIQAAALIRFGTPDQQQRYLPEILAGEAIHGMGYSEPNAGSDLAALQTRAVRDGDEWVITGQKIWTTTFWGQYMFLGARTDPKAEPKHAGISTFIVPMTAPGITVKPSRTMYDGRFANIFYDEVRLPADALLGKENEGWTVLTSALATERGLVGGGIALKVVRLFELFCVQLRDAVESSSSVDTLTRERIAKIAAEIEVGRRLMLACAERAVDGVTPAEYAAVSKVFAGELMERFCEAALELLGMPAALSQEAEDNLENGRFEQSLRHSLMWVISIGTNEIQRSLIAQRALGLPR